MSDDQKKKDRDQYIRQELARLSGAPVFSPWHKDNKISHDDDSVIHEGGD